jgi:hypothetical protein
LENTLGKQRCGVFPERIRPYLDYQIIGEEFYADHGGAFCRAGYVVRNDELPEQLRQSKQMRSGSWRFGCG